MGWEENYSALKEQHFWFLNYRMNIFPRALKRDVPELLAPGATALAGQVLFPVQFIS